MTNISTEPNAHGPRYLVLSAASFAVMAALVHRASLSVPVGTIVWTRLLVSLVASFVTLRHRGIAIASERMGPLLLRGLLGAGALACYFVTLASLPLAQATTIQNAAPLLVALFAWLVLRERPTLRIWTAMALGFAGIALAGQLWTLQWNHGSAIALACLGAVLSASAYVTVRELTRTEPALRIVFFFPVVALPLTTPWFVTTWQPITWMDGALLLAIGLTTQAGQVCMTLGLKSVAAGHAAAIGFLQVPMTMALGLLYGEVPGVWVVAGALSVLAGQAVLLQHPGRKME